MLRADPSQALRESEERYRMLFESIDEGFCIFEVLFDGDEAVDYRFLEVNPAFEKHSGLRDAVGRSIREMVPDHELFWFRLYGDVVRTGEPVRIEHRGDALPEPGWYDVYAFRVGAPEERRVAAIFSNITKRKEAEEALREQDRRKDEFLALLAHELRNPLAVIRNSVHLLQRSGGRPERIGVAVGLLDRQTTHMARLVEDLLDVSRINRGVVDLRRDRVDLSTVIEDAVAGIRPACEAKRQTLRVVEPSGPVLLFADATRLVQVVENLLENASKFTGEGGHVELSAQVQGDEVVLRVRDDGVGIAREDLERIFEMFAQADTSTTRAQKGLGVGLTLVSTFVTMHGGRVEARSDGLGHGSEFVVRLPVGPGDEPAGNAAAASTPQ